MQTIHTVILGTALGLILTGVAQISQAAGRHSDSAGAYQASAKVVQVQPLYRTVSVVTPREVCGERRVWQAANGSTGSHTPKIVGGIIGGVVGNQFGSGRGRDLMTAAGALLGASIGADASRRHADTGGYYRMEQQCYVEEVTHLEERADGYQVTYRYGGQEFVTRMASAPGPTIPVRIRVEPMAYNGDSYY